MSNVDLNMKFPSLKPIKKAPSLYTVNGIGFKLYGNRNHDDETGTYVSTWCFCLLYVPIFCLTAYRVARAQGNAYYFIGREPLSDLAKVFNAFVIAGMVAAFGGVQYNNFISSPEYIARSRMEQAAAFVEDGRIGQGARSYKSLIDGSTVEADNAVFAIQHLLDQNCTQVPLSQAADVLAVAAQLAHHGRAFESDEIARLGMKWVTEKGDADLNGGIQVLDIIRPLVIDTRQIDDQRLRLLQSWAVIEPKKLDVVVPLAELLEQRGDLVAAEKLLEPVKDKLGEGEGARVLGLILGGKGNWDGAYALLWPYVSPRLDSLHQAETDSRQTFERLWDREVDVLKNNQGPPGFYQRYEAADEQAKLELVQTHIYEKIKRNSRYIRTQETLQKRAEVVPIALELGIVMLNRAQSQADSTERTKQLTAVEEIFLAISGIAGESDAYRLSLGQVYYWLGRHGDGRKLFDDYLESKQRAPESLNAVAETLRLLGSVPEAKSLAKEAFDKSGEGNDRKYAANLMALCTTETKERIEWLKLSDLEDPSTRATLASMIGLQAYQEGRNDDALHQFEVALAAQETLPRSSKSLNDTALSHYYMFTVTGEHKTFAQAIDYFQQAVSLDPKNAILLFNAGMTLLAGTITDVVADELDLRSLRHTAEVSDLGYLYADESGRAELLERLKAHPGFTRAMTFLETAMVVSPKGLRAYEAYYTVQSTFRDEDVLRTLDQRVGAAGFDLTDRLADFQKYLSGEVDAVSRITSEAALKRAEQAVANMQSKRGPTYAHAIGDLIELSLVYQYYGGTVDVDRLVDLAEESVRSSPCSSTRTTLEGALLARACKTLRAASPDFEAAWSEHYRSIGSAYLLAALVAEPGPMGDAILHDPDILAALSIMKENCTRFPKSVTPYEWAWFRTADPAAAEEVRRRLASSPLEALRHSIDSRLNPFKPSVALDGYWLWLALGEPNKAKVELNQLSNYGFTLPVKVE